MPTVNGRSAKPGAGRSSCASGKNGSGPHGTRTPSASPATPSRHERRTSQDGHGNLSLVTPCAQPLDPRPTAGSERPRPVAAVCLPGRDRARARRPARRGRHGFPDQPRVPLALRDVRPLAEHAGGDRPGGCHRGPDRICPGSPAADDSGTRFVSSSTTRAVSSTRVRSRPGNTRRSRGWRRPSGGPSSNATPPWSERAASSSATCSPAGWKSRWAWRRSTPKCWHGSTRA